MNKPGIAIFILLTFTSFVSAQTRNELEEQRKKTLEEINYVDGMIKNTEQEKNQNLSSLKILGNKVSLRQSVIEGMGKEIGLLNERIDLNTPLS